MRSTISKFQIAKCSEFIALSRYYKKIGSKKLYIEEKNSKTFKKIFPRRTKNFPSN